MSQSSVDARKPITRLTTAQGFIAGGMAACMAVTLTNPAEVAKTRLQLQGELARKGQAPRVYNGAIHAMVKIFRTEGIRGLQRGLGTAYFYQILLNGSRLGFYDPTRRFLSHALYGDEDHNNVIINVFSGMTSGAAGALLGSPLFMIKTRMQAYSPVNPIGFQHKYKNLVDGLIRVAREDGVRGLYRGLDAALIRTMAGSSVQLPIYNWAKKTVTEMNILPAGPAVHLAASSVSGVGVCLFMQLFDTIMTRMYNQDGHQLYKNIFDCFYKTVRTEGFFALYKGFFAHCTRIIPHTIFTLMFLEQTSKFMLWAVNKQNRTEYADA